MCSMLLYPSNKKCVFFLIFYFQNPETVALGTDTNKRKKGGHVSVIIIKKMLYIFYVMKRLGDGLLSCCCQQ